jgi:hypothetical protein
VLLQRILSGGRERLGLELGREFQILAAAGGREALLHQVDHEHHRKLEPLGPVGGEQAHHVLIGLDLGRRGVVTHLDQQVQVLDERRHAVLLEQQPDARGDAEELVQVLHALERGGGPGDALVGREPPSSPLSVTNW